MNVNVFDFIVKDKKGNDVSLKQYEGKVLLIVNTASQCGLTPQFAGLEKLYKQYGPNNFVVLGFPCNQFANQERGTNDEIQTFCQLNYGVTFPILSKIDVNGKDADPLYVYLKKQTGGMFGKRIKWNFTKFLVNQKGEIVKRFAPVIKPEDIEVEIQKLLNVGDR